MSAKNRLKALVGNYIKKFQSMPRSTPQEIRESAWAVSEGLQDWQRRIIYGKIMQKFSTSQMKKQYNARIEAESEQAIIDMKEGY